MSLINDALKDLARSNKTGQKTNPCGYKGLVHPAESENKHTFLILFSVLMSILFIGTLMFVLLRNVNWGSFGHPKSQSKPTALLPQDLPVKHPVVPQQAIQPSTPVALPAANNEQQAVSLYEQALSEIKAGNLKLAITDLQKVISMTPRNNKARQVLIVLLLQGEQKAQANDILNQGLIISPDYLPFVKLKAHFLIDDKNYQAALSLMDQYAPALTEDPDFYALKASIDEIASNYNEAITLYTQLVKEFSDNASWWVGLGIAYQSEGKKEEAKDAFSKALSLGGLDPTVQDYIRQQINAD